MRYANRFTVITVAPATGALCHADPFVCVERWASGTLTTGEEFESWRIHVVVPDGQSWGRSQIDGRLLRRR